MKAIACFFFVCFIWLFACENVSADIIHFKDNEIIEGTIVKQTENEVLLDVGSGIMAFPREAIIGIEASAIGPAKKKQENRIPQESQQKSSYIPSNYVEKLYTRVRDILEKRKKVVQYQQRCMEMYTAIEDMKQRYSKYSYVLETLQSDASEYYAVGDMVKYNRTLIDMNTYRSKKNYAIEEITQLFKKRTITEGRMQKVVEELFLDEYQFNDLWLDVDENRIAPEDQYYYQELEKDAATFTQDFVLYALPYKETQSGRVVDVIINNDKPYSFLIDFNFPVVAVSEWVATELDLYGEVTGSPLSFAPFNERIAEGPPVFLRTVMVYKLQTSNVATIISSDINYKDIDGVLGMSFARQCVIREDPQNNKYLIYQFSE